MSVWTDFLNDNPEVAYYSMIPQSRSRNYTDYWNSQYGNIFNRFQGAFGRQGVENNPGLAWTDYLSRFWNPEDEWKKLSPQKQGGMNVPRVGWNTWW